MNPFADRRYVFLILFAFVAMIFLGRLFYIQIIDRSYRISASNNVLRYVTAYPSRGLIYDRNGELLVYNQPAYDLMVIPRQVKNIDTADLCTLLAISKEEFISKIKEARKYSSLKASVFLKQLSAEIYGAFLERMYQFPGFFVQVRTMRKYPKNIAANAVGYISEVDENTIKKNSYYRSGDYIGMGGLEQSYEDILRGKRGVKIFVVDVHNRIVGSYLNGLYDTLPVPGLNVVSTLSSSLQEYGEKLMQNKIGSIAAIEPATGEVLALVTSPTYDPNLLVGRVRSANYKKLLTDSLNPLFNRALMAMYPPGSIFKIVECLVGLQDEVLTWNTVLPCNKSLVNCHNHPSPLDLDGSVQHSCNPFYYMVFKKILYGGATLELAKGEGGTSEQGLNAWRRHVISFGLGSRLGIDIPNEKGGYIPTSIYYNKVYGKNRWNFYTIYSLGIGQGEIMIVPLQMANITAIIANRGFYYLPHLIKGFGEHKMVLPHFTVRNLTTINPEHFEPLVDAMEKVVQSGTATRAKLKDVSICGKTGTAQNPHGEDHSVFIAFAPKDTPQIAISVVVENSGFGGTWAAPIASLMIEKYLNDTISRPELEKYILDEDFIHPKAEKKEVNKPERVD
ncbi:MAG: penicillin-binding protein 2 [Bacteroidetes bacterium]|nr:penicillin-binding protein 2 [Bacteroidota bacterium]